MMLSKTVIGVGLAVIFALLAALHVFWACGGTWSSGAADRGTLRPAQIRAVPGATLAVAAALAGATCVVLARADLILGFLPPRVSQWAALGAWWLAFG
jgi:hypothetical protein